MRVEVTERCTGHGRCYSEVPGLFEDDEAGYGVVLGDGTFGAGDIEAARTAVHGCPENAVRIVP
ncbi:MAG: ferredoxin [Ilumatobacteraceae bacterium]|nr:ferredoxin [Ilumatobacteraceae bacterium]MCU1386745.1 ferredoxin [Ilumatobacteraceae bacterium]